MPLPYPTITQLPTLPKPAAVPSLWNTRYGEIDENFAYVSQSLANQNPAGEVCFFATISAPNGFLKANGALISRTVYANLFSAIGVTFGVGDSVSTFALPDLRGEFIRGADDGRGVDIGRQLGSSQTGGNQDHWHTMPTATGDNIEQEAGIDVVFMDGYSSMEAGVATNISQLGYAGRGNNQDFVGGRLLRTYRQSTSNFAAYTEARPRNIALLACIKY